MCGNTCAPSPTTTKHPITSPPTIKNHITTPSIALQWRLKQQTTDERNNAARMTKTIARDNRRFNSSIVADEPSDSDSMEILLRDISQDHRNKTRFMQLYYSHSRLLQEAWGNQHFFIYHHLLSCRRTPSYSYCLNECVYSWRFCCIQPHGGGKTRHYWWPPGPPFSYCKIAFVA